MGSTNSKNGEITPYDQRLEEKFPVAVYDDKHDRRINCMCLSPNKEFLVTGGEDRTIRQWEIETRTCVDVMEGHQSYITCLLVMEDFIVSGSGDRTIKKWNFTNAKLVHTFEGHDAAIKRIEVFDALLFSSSFDKKANLYDFNSGEYLRSFDAHTKLVSTVIPIPDRSILLTASGDGTLRTWNYTSGECINVFSGHCGAVLCVQVDLKNKLIYTGGADKMVRQWDMDTAATKARFIGHIGAVLCLFIHTKRHVIYSGSSDEAIRKWSTRSKKGRMTTGRLRCGSIAEIVLPPDSEYGDKIVFAGTAAGLVLCIDVASMGIVRVYRPQIKGVPLFLLYNGLMYTGTYSGEVKVWQADMASIMTGEEEEDD